MNSEKLRRYFVSNMYPYKTPFFTALITGFLAHGYALTNKLVNADEIQSLFSKGATYTSGRWGIELFRFLLPDYSMPWLWGIMTILLVSVAACVLLEIFQIHNRVLQCLLAAVTVALPSVTGVLCYMFTSSMFGLALVFSVLSVLLYEKQKWLPVLAALVLMILSLSIYQSYVSLAAGVFVILMLKELAEGEKSAGAVFLAGVKRLSFLVVALLGYLLLSKVAVSLVGKELETYAYNESGFFYRIAIAYSAFLHTFTRNYFCFINTGVSKVAHFTGLAVVAALMVKELRSMRDAARIALFLLCLCMFPLALYSVYLLASPAVIHTLVLFSFVLVYYLAAVFAEIHNSPESNRSRAARRILALTLAVTVCSNVFFANKVYLKLQIDYENAYSVFTSIVIRIQTSQDYTPETKIYIAGEYEGTGMDEKFDLDTTQFVAVNKNLYNVYTRTIFIENYLGFKANFVEGPEYKRTLMKTEEFAAMPCYPDHGCIQMIDDILVVKLSD